jgi:hypothetical protein
MASKLKEDHTHTDDDCKVNFYYSDYGLFSDLSRVNDLICTCISEVHGNVVRAKKNGDNEVVRANKNRDNEVVRAKKNGDNERANNSTRFQFASSNSTASLLESRSHTTSDGGGRLASDIIAAEASGWSRSYPGYAQSCIDDSDDAEDSRCAGYTHLNVPNSNPNMILIGDKSRN